MLLQIAPSSLLAEVLDLLLVSTIELVRAHRASKSTDPYSSKILFHNDLIDSFFHKSRLN